MERNELVKALVSAWAIITFGPAILGLIISIPFILFFIAGFTGPLFIGAGIFGLYLINRYYIN